MPSYQTCADCRRTDDAKRPVLYCQLVRPYRKRPLFLCVGCIADRVTQQGQAIRVNVYGIRPKERA